jgi:hypothetical protein
VRGGAQRGAEAHEPGAGSAPGSLSLTLWPLYRCGTRWAFRSLPPTPYIRPSP